MKPKKKRLYFLTQQLSFKNQGTLISVLQDWLALCRILSQPTTYHFDDSKDHHPFDEEEILDYFNKLPFSSDNLLTIQSDEAEFSIQLKSDSVRQRGLIDKEIAEQHIKLLEDYVTSVMAESGLYAYMRDIEEYLSHNVQSFEDREEEELTYPKKLPKMYDDQQEVIVDCSQLAGFDSYFKGLCFTSSWKMWFSPIYYNIIPKQAFIDVQQVNSVVSEKNDVIKITLYDSPWSWQHPANLNFQLLFRDQLGFDQLEWSNGVGVLREPFAEFIRLGENTQMVQYQNENLQPTSKRTARHFTTRVFNYETNQYLEGRRFGVLNARAYYPWRDNNRKIMMAYWILNPIFMLDRGLEAFKFYIDHYLQVEFEDDQTKDFLPILRFYVPKDTLGDLPIDLIVSELKKEEITVKKRSKKKPLFHLHREGSRLQVEFVDVRELDTKKNVQSSIRSKESPFDRLSRWLKGKVV